MLTNADVKKYIDKRLEDGAIRGPGGTSNRAATAAHLGFT